MGDVVQLHWRSGWAPVVGARVRMCLTDQPLTDAVGHVLEAEPARALVRFTRGRGERWVPTLDLTPADEDMWPWDT